MVSIDSLTVRFNGEELFSNISFLINKKERLGLTGKNGAGKSTLLKVIIGEQEADEGGVSKPTDVSLGYLPQHMNVTNNSSIINETLKAFDEVNTLSKSIEQLSYQIAERTDYETNSYHNLIDKLTEKTQRFDILNGANIRGEAEKTLKGLGFLSSDFDKSTSTLSGGWRMRIELAKILLKKPKLLLLDEPTNHLDIEAIYWLENFLKSYYGAIVVISHDRAFLDGVTERTIEISLGKIYDYKANFSNYEILRKERRQQQLNAYENQKKQIEKTEDFINRFRYQATKAVQVQSKIKQLAKVERIEVDDDDNAKIHFKFPPSPRSGTVVTETKDLCKSFKEKEVLKNINFIIERGEKVAFVGKNGEGKSTLSKIIIGELDYYGNLKLGHNLKIGYFAQNQELLLDTEKTVFETLDDIAEGEVRKNVRNLLGSFLFSGEDIDKKVKVLSGGEKTRLALSKLLLEPYNLLVLDEPTNHLDIKSKEVLKYALKNYDGTLIVVSHDRDFLNGLVDKIYEFKDKNIKQFIGNIYDFLEMKNLESLDMLNKNSVSKISEKKEISTNKLDYEERKQLARDVRKLENQILNIEKEIEEIEKEILNLNNLLGNPAKITAENIDYSELYKTIEKLNKKLEEKTYEWEVVSIQKDEIEIGLQ